MEISLFILLYAVLIILYNQILNIFQEDVPKALRPVKVAENFTEFIEQVCYGDLIKKKRLQKFSEDPEKCEDDEESWSDGEDEEKEIELPDQTFTYFVGSK